MIVVIRAFIELFKLIKHEKELDRKIFVFFILYDYIFVKIYDYYFVIKENRIIFYYYLIHKFDFTILNNKKK